MISVRIIILQKVIHAVLKNIIDNAEDELSIYVCSKCSILNMKVIIVPIFNMYAHTVSHMDAHNTDMDAYISLNDF